MTLALHNTLERRRHVFVPLEPGVVSFYTCGPTVYDFAHIGNFRSFLAADLLRRWLESPLCRRVEPDGEPADAFGYRVTHVMNITDVGHMVDDAQADGAGEDKMVAAQRRLADAKKTGALPPGLADDVDPNDPCAVARFYADAFISDAKLLGVKVAHQADDDPSLMPRPTDMIREMLEITLALIERGHAYIASDGVAYFDVGSFPDYGSLSGNTPDAIRAGAGGRVDAAQQSVKKHPADFMLWKPDPTHLMRWDPDAVLGRETPLGEGYPGWHLECSAMARARLGDVIDLHSGGEDNIFPHHECEIAQSRCVTGRPHLARYWFHPRFLMVNGEKMSKSKGTFFTVRDLAARGFPPAAVRLELIKTHYRQNANFTEQGLVDAARQAERWRAFEQRAAASNVDGERDTHTADAFADAMNDDLNVAGAIGVMNAWMKRTAEPTRADGELFALFDAVLGVVERPARWPEGYAELAQPPGDDADHAALDDHRIDAMVEARTAARAAKDFAEADRLRDQLAAAGIEITDGPEGTSWARKASL